VKQGGQFQLVQNRVIEMGGLSDPKRNGCRLLPVSCLPRQQPIELFAHLPDQDGFEVATGGLRQMKMVDLSQHALNPHYGRLDLSCCLDTHDTPP
jgi:hypothetical protein